ncbi:MAG: hypothetical protein A2294_04135 [Candidatus Magasanikbacteria bacterium RIFOXYB2_FULL_38_10]|nr:MAG: hypothetical protein A2294_04135 [Candidatus Magasanikbacteria bacterium RIFOXYB2_FULL_38_10]
MEFTWAEIIKGILLFLSILLNFGLFVCWGEFEYKPRRFARYWRKQAAKSDIKMPMPIMIPEPPAWWFKYRNRLIVLWFMNLLLGVSLISLWGVGII